MSFGKVVTNGDSVSTIYTVVESVVEFPQASMAVHLQVKKKVFGQTFSTLEESKSTITFPTQLF